MTTSPHPSSLSLSTPGRICLFGEHQDYLGLPVIAGAISRRIAIDGTMRSDRTMVLDLPDIGKKLSFELNGTLGYTEDRDYFRSCVNVLQKHGHKFSHGYDCRVHGNIPINAGASSSSALVVSWIHFLSLVSDLPVPLSQEDIGKLAYEAEVLEFSEPGGMMDQYSTALGGLIYLESYPQVKIAPLQAPLGALVLGNSHEYKDTKAVLSRVKAVVSEAAAAARSIYADFSFHRMTVDQLGTFKKRVNADQYARLEATIVNRDLTMKARDLLQTKKIDHDALGEMLNAHQAMLRDVLEVSTPKIDAMINVALNAGAKGAKINGSGGGGCMFAYAPENPEKVARALGDFGEATIVTIDCGTARNNKRG